MLRKLSLKNYKSFKELDSLELKKLTVVVGKNSCGKSSILQSLLLLKQTIESKQNVALNLQGEYLTYSSLQEISFGKPQINHAKITYGLETTDVFGAKTMCHFEVGNKKFTDGYQPYVSKLLLETHDGNKVNLNRKPSITKERNFFTNAFKRASSNSEVNYNYLGTEFNAFVPTELYYAISFGDFESNKIGFSGSAFYDYALIHTLNSLKESIQKIKYLSPIRATPSRDYLNYVKSPDELDHDGTNAAHVLWAKRNEIVLWKGQSYTLLEALSESLVCMGLGQQVSPAKLGEIIYRVQVSAPNTSSHVSLADVGFGYSQILPIILLGLLSNRKDTILLEQPEIHLHPSSAANLADLFLGLIEDGRSFLIETHSPELINRLRLRVIENPSLSKDINIVFVESDGENGSSIKQFQIDEDGMFPEWPDGFLDESKKIADALIKARMARVKDEW
ncbi:AAA family ATPase [Photobacterium leiognathi]|uniref:AAA family ATPase n=1 Tax=Photobacterium leiognathi TaxID=553611 RepID=UPI0029827A92|nr:DUF3696 domain-containing protein [Photobacterium leiognathi]